MAVGDMENGASHKQVQQVFDELAAAEVDAGYEKRRGKNAASRMFYHILSFVIPGMGMFCEAYFVFSIGNLKPIFKTLYPECWKTHTVCSAKLSDSLTYTQVSGIIFGQLVIGFFADRIGRKVGSIMTASIMLIFGILMAASSGPDAGGLFTMFTVVQFFFGIGVGGEYPVASTSANERAENTAHLTRRRGETVVCVFSMQGWGNLVNTMILVILMGAFGQTAAPYNNRSLEIVWRLSYALGCIPLVFMVLWRVFVLKESNVWLKKRQSVKDLGDSTGYNNKKNKLLLKHYWHRIFGCSLSWFVWDFAFYGNKLFQSTFINIIVPGASLLTALEWTLLNSTVALVGYYFAAFTIDKPWMGRRFMQIMGFAWMFVLFTACAAAYDQLLANAIHAFQFLYFFSSFWGQFGPNATTWLLPAETVPTETRSMCHGFAAAIGKAGALVAGVVFNKVSDRGKFWISAACGLAGMVVTYILIPDLTGLDLREGDKRWLAILSGDEAAYDGDAVNPKHLSSFERYVLKVNKFYNPASTKTGDPAVTVAPLPKGSDSNVKV